MLIILIFLSLFFPTTNIFLQISILRKYKKVQYNSDYFREILTYSPSEVFYIYNKNFSNKMEYNYFPAMKFKDLFLINLLKMHLLNYIDIDFSDKNNFKVIKKDIMILDEEYAAINNYIFSSITSDKEITLYEIYRHIGDYYNNTFFKNWEELIQKKIRSRGYYDGNFITFHQEQIKKLYKINIPIIVILNLIIFFFSFRMGLLMLVLFPAFLFCGYQESKYHKVISDKGIYEYRKIMALKKFLEDFSVMENKTPEYTKLLEDYIIYAHIFNLTK